MKGIVKSVGVLVFAAIIVFSFILCNRSEAQAAAHSDPEYVVVEWGTGSKFTFSSKRFDLTIKPVGDRTRVENYVALCNYMSSNGYELVQYNGDLCFFRKTK